MSYSTRTINVDLMQGEIAWLSEKVELEIPLSQKERVFLISVINDYNQQYEEYGFKMVFDEKELKHSPKTDTAMVNLVKAILGLELLELEREGAL